MKTSFKFLIAGLTLAFASSAMAAATMKDVETAVNVNHDYRLAEKLIGELSANSPDDARDHWVYAQILHHNGKDDRALKELNDAKRLDPKSSFVKDPHKVAIFEASLNSSGPSTASRHDAITTPSVAPVAPVQTAQVVQPMAPVTPAPAHKSSHTLLWVILILVVVGVAGFIFARRVQAGDRREEEDRIKAARQDQLKQANTLLESVKPFKLDLRIANPPRPDLVSELEGVERDLVALIERLSQSPVAQGEIDRASARLNKLRREYEGKPDPAPAPSQPTYQNSPNGQFNDNEFSPVGNAGGAPVYQQGQPIQQMQPVYQPVMQPVMQPVYQQPVQPVYIEENNGGIGAGGGFVAGMVLGSLMGEHEHRDREVIHEVREVREIREVPEQQYRQDQQQSDIDFGQESTNDSSNDSGNDSSSVDFGSSDDDN